MDFSSIRDLCANVKNSVQTVIVGKDEVIELMLTALIARGHVLVEDVPGTGKTVAAKALARSLDCSFGRIQFTPDLLPSDVTGMSIYDQRTGDFSWKAGPIFRGIVLADEINRATPRTQSALLECMEERTVTEGGETRSLPRPFMVLATQNPIEIQGTFPLPEAQLDRFFLRLRMGYPSTQEALAILNRFQQADPLSTLTPVATAEAIIAAQELFPSVLVSDAVREYIVALVERTRALEGILLGVSPRGSLAMMRAAQVWALLRGRDYVLPDDVKALAVPVLAHRIVLRSALSRAGAAEAAIEEAVKLTPVPSEA